MKKLLKVEYAVLRHFDIKPTDIQMADGMDWMPPLADVATFCMHEGYGYAAYDKVTAGLLLYNLAEKLCTSEDDYFAKVDLATWVLSHYFTKEELMKLSAKDCVKFLQDWKYYFGFRKMDESDAETYIYNAIQVLDGKWHLDENDEEISYVILD